MRPLATYFASSCCEQLTLDAWRALNNPSCFPASLKRACQGESWAPRAIGRSVTSRCGGPSFWMLKGELLVDLFLAMTGKDQLVVDLFLTMRKKISTCG